MYQKTASSILIGLSIILLLLNLVLVYLAYVTTLNLRADAYVINTAGIIRGSIQRLTKLELNGCGQTCDKITKNIDDHIDEFINGELINSSREPGKQFIHRLTQLREKWSLLKNLLRSHKTQPSEQLEQEIIITSEHCWEIADSAVYMAQIDTESKVNAFRIFYPVVFMIVFCNLLVIVFAYTTIRKKLEYRIAVDSLTGLYNRKFFDQSLEIEISRSSRFNRVFSLIYFDIDHFKRINDTYGHHAGDEALEMVSDLVKSSVRKTDIVCRIGGEEFAIISAETDREAAIDLAEKIRQKIEGLKTDTVSGLTISLGIAVFNQPCTKKELIKHADEALYEAKRNGRNRIECYG